MNVNKQYKVAAVQASPVFWTQMPRLKRPFAHGRSREERCPSRRFLKHGFRVILGLSGSMHLQGLQFIPEYSQNSIRTDG